MSSPHHRTDGPAGRGPAEDALDARTRRARTEEMTVRAVGGGVYEVHSESDATYAVDVPGGRCTCPDHTYRRVWCKHLRRVAQAIAKGRVPPPGHVTVDCAACGAATVVDERAEPPHYCENCDLEPGEFAVDREAGDLVVVVEPPRGRADETAVPGHDVTVAEYPGNEPYPDEDPVVEVLYPLPAGVDGDDVEARHLRRYRFPVSRLRAAGEDERAD
jgi:hypothetical protein